MNRARQRVAHRIDKSNKIVVLVMCGTRKEAARIARALVDQRLAACANVLQAPVRSIYRWEGKVDTAREFLLIAKSSRRQFGALQRSVLRLHSYDLPEIIALPITDGLPGYLSWISESLST